MFCQLVFTAALLVAAAPEAVPTPAPDKPLTAEELEVAYARARLALAQTNLKRVEELNRKLARSVPASVVADLQSDVAEADLQLQQASSADQDEFAVWLSRAQGELKSAHTRWKNALDANARLKDAKNSQLFGALDIERFRLRAEVARLQWERGRQLVSAPRAAQLEWQVELLNNEVDRLREEATQVSPFVRYYPIYWYLY
jgi:hypothetical protein